MQRFVTWLFWTLWYCWQPRPREFGAYMNRAIRTLPPWRKFRPYVWHNDDGAFWDICWADDQTYTKRMWLAVDAKVSEASGNIVGLSVNDEDLTHEQGG